MSEYVRVILDRGWAEKCFSEMRGLTPGERHRWRSRRVLLVAREFNDERGDNPECEITVYDGESMYGTAVMGGIYVGQRDLPGQDRYGDHAPREWLLSFLRKLSKHGYNGGLAIDARVGEGQRTVAPIVRIGIDAEAIELRFDRAFEPKRWNAEEGCAVGEDAAP